MSLPSVITLIGQIYGAALGEEDWRVVVGGISALLGAEAAALHPTGVPAAAHPATRIGCDPAYVPLYNAHYHLVWPMLPLMRRLPAGSVFFDRMLVPEDAFFRTEFYNDYARPQGRYSALYWVDIDRRGMAAHLSLWRPRGRPSWGPEEIRLLRLLGPHLDRALRLRRRLAAAAADAGGTMTLTPRERDCMACIARGASSKQAARLLALSAHTVDEYIKSAMRKLWATSRSEAVATALHLGLIDS